MANYTIEARSLGILGVASHNFWVLRNSDTGKVIAELETLATNRLTGKPEPIGTDDKLYSLRVWHYVHDASYAAQLSVSLANATYISEGQSSQIVFSGDSVYALARWETAVRTIPFLNSLDLNYPAFGGNIFSDTVNSNSGYGTLGDLMGFTNIPDFSWRVEPGLDNRMITPSQIDSLKYKPNLDWNSIFNSANNSYDPTTNLFNLKIDPSILNYHTTTGETPVSIDNSTLINDGISNVKGVGDVNLATGI